MNQQAENHTEHVYMCRHTQAHESEVHFQLEMKREKQMACSRLHGALFESDYLLLKARDVSVKTKYSGANIKKKKRKTRISMVRKVKLNHKSHPAANSMSFYLF